MPRLRIILDEETFEALERRADAEKRPTDWQAEVLIRQSLGLPFPYPKEQRQANAQVMGDV